MKKKSTAQGVTRQNVYNRVKDVQIQTIIAKLVGGEGMCAVGLGD